MKLSKKVLYELLVLLSSVLIFRSLWTLLDKIPAMTKDSGLYVLLIIGLVLAYTSMNYLNKN